MILTRLAVKQVVREGRGWPHLVNPTDPALSGVQAANLVLATGLRTRTCLIIIIIIIINIIVVVVIIIAIIIITIVIIIIRTFRKGQLGYRSEGSVILKATGGMGVHLP